MTITSKNKGKRAGARVITYVVVMTRDSSDVKLLMIYDKSERDNISDEELNEIRRNNGLL